MFRRFMTIMRDALVAQTLPFPREAEQHPPDTRRIPDHTIWMR